MWGKVQALASRPGLVSLRSCTHGRFCAVGAAPPWCLCHVEPEPELVSVTSCWQRPPGHTPWTPLPSSYQLLPYNDLEEAESWLSSWDVLGGPAQGDVPSIPWQWCEHCLANPLGFMCLDTRQGCGK